MLPVLAAASPAARRLGGAPLVMTSGNVSDEPIAFRDEDALERLGTASPTCCSSTTARSRHAPTTRSCARSMRRAASASCSSGARADMCPRACRCRTHASADAGVRRRAQEHVLPGARAARVGVPPHRRPRELRHAALVHRRGRAFRRLFAVQPERHSPRPASRVPVEQVRAGARGVEVIGVQHHHAHLAACLAEHGEQGTAVGAIFDGSGYGPDGTIWGGELLLGDLSDFRRVGMLLPVPLPGGERAIPEPWRMACAWLTAVARRTRRRALELPRTLRRRVAQRTWEQVSRLTSGGPVSPLTSSVGRLFDAARCALRPASPGQLRGPGRGELEAACDTGEHDRYPISLERRGGLIVIDPRQTIAALMCDIAPGVATRTDRRPLPRRARRRNRPGACRCRGRSRRERSCWPVASFRTAACWRASASAPPVPGCAC